MKNRFNNDIRTIRNLNQSRIYSNAELNGSSHQYIAVLYFFLIFSFLALQSNAQVKVSINSGNPKFPFPQFNAYENSSGVLDNLGTKNPVGVTHAEMEKTIREAYQIQMNRAEKKGGSFGGIDYIHFRSVPECSEGSGYGILGAAAMADKPMFDGMWLWIHDNAMKRVKRYNDCGESANDYMYSQLPDWMNDYKNGNGQGSATDGDVDIALALLCAYKQWGEFMGIKDACGNQISYKQAAIDFLTAMTDTLVFKSSQTTLVSGDIGLDGYIKNGDKGPTLTDWANSVQRSGFTKTPEPSGPSKVCIDYSAPSYFNQFADFLALEDSVKYAWNIYQFRRGAASCDWLMGKLVENQKYIPFAGSCSLSTDQPVFGPYSDGEDFRLAWRTILNYVWNGNPKSTWDPITHQVKNVVPNTFELDAAKRYSKFLWDSRQSPWGNACEKVSNSTFEYWGPSVLRYYYDITGKPQTTFVLNWVPGTGSPTAVAVQDFNLMAELYRTCETTWDAEKTGDRYLTSVPKYFHGWFRLLGMLVLTGNYQSPGTFKPGANCKVYLSIDKTFAFEKDTVTYTIDYRNYGSIDAEGVTIIDTLHKDFQFVSASNSGVYNNAAHIVTWKVGKVSGFKSATGIDPTMGQVKLKVIIKTATEKQYRNRVIISCDNGTGWTSNEYPNTVSSVMQRNYLDIAKRALVLDQTASKSLVKPGDNVEFSINFLNSSEAGWINGGRSGVRFSFALGDANTNSDGKKMRFRLFHDAQEAYIDYGNYRMSYFMYDSLITCYSKDVGCTKGWGIRFDFNEGVDTGSVKVFQENIVPGQDSLGKWNQRIVLQFSDPLDPKRKESLSAFDYLVRQYYKVPDNIHRGGDEPLRLQWELFNATYMPPKPTWDKHWSWDAKAVEISEGSMFFPVTNDWTDPDKPDIPIDSWHPKACSKASHTIDNILVEEWDGYTWRRVAGNGPMPGREANNVIIRDTIPEGFTFVSFTGENPMGVAPTINGRVITWKVSKMQIKEGGTIKFTAKADGSCPGAADREVYNRSWISADKESPFADSSLLTVSCDTVVKPPTPDHIDLVLDTIAFNRSTDEPLARVTLDAGNLSTTVYAIVRDKKGKFLNYATSAIWTSRNDSVATVKAGTVKSNATITKVEKGATFIVVSDPSPPGLKSDSVAITVIPAPPWPAISEAIMLDKNADLIPDSMKIRLNRPFQTNQNLDSVVVFYRGEYISLPASAVKLNDTIITFSINNLTTIDPRPSGTAYLKMSVEGSGKQVSKSIADGIGPAILEARLYESADRKNDTLLLVFSEEVHTMNFDNKTLQLIKSGSNDTVSVPILTASPAGIYIQTRVALSQQSSNRPEVGDFIRFLPGEKGGSSIDVALNPAHLKNKAVVIKSGPPSIVKAWYSDNNADGIVKDIYVRFLRPVDISNISFTVNWREALAGNIKDNSLSYLTNDSTTVHIVLPDNFTNTISIRTSGKIFLKPEFLSTNEYQTGWATDSAAPVILHASINVAVLTNDIKVSDTLRVVFSEPISIINTLKPFTFTSQKNVPYTMNLSFLSIKDTIGTFLINDYDPAVYPSSGDSIRIYTNAVKDTAGNVQSNEHNRNAILTIKQGTFKILIKAGPNPLNTNGKAITITAAPDGKFRTGIGLEAKVSIFDNLGNCIISETPMYIDSRTQDATYEWKALNRHGRKVGTGTYIAVVKAKSVIGETSGKILIGVRNEPVMEEK
jgi:uncharacterized repeat protein (TIGR01451 family)